MNLTIGRCCECRKCRLVDIIDGIKLCFACKQRSKQTQKRSKNWKPLQKQPIVES